VFNYSIWDKQMKKKIKRVHRRKLIPFKWLGTILCTIGIALTSFNIYPLNIFIMFVGTGIWCAVGTLQKDWPLATGELISVILYASGIVFFIASLFL
jgi:predicted anti-sigma-YlaC factor YlaD